MLSMRVVGIIISSFLCCVTCRAVEKTDDGPIVQLPKGRILGRLLTSGNGSDYYAFQDIPYAAPPTGENRFRPPKSPQAWNGTLDATDNTKICIVGTYPFTFPIYIPLTNATQTEDCLYLNVYTPVKPGSNDSLPVYVYIPGGGFIFGDGSFELYGPKHLMDYGVVVVTMNYRLDVLGFLTTGDGVIPGNLGLKDQNFAMRWVYKNIKLFGGNPKKITLGGESAGGASVGYHLLSERSKGLFSSAIMQSGTALNTWGYQTKPATYAFALGNLLDNSTGYTNTKELLSVLRSASTVDIFAAAAKIPFNESQDGALNDLIWTPVIEDDSLNDTFLTVHMHDAYQSGNFTKVPILIGFNDEEAFQYPDSTTASTFEELFDNDTSLLVNEKFNLSAENNSIVGDALWKLYTNNTSFAENLTGLVKFTSDSFITRAVIRFVDLTNQYVPTYFYKYSYGGDTSYNFTDAGNVGHLFELRFIWDWTYWPDTSDFDSTMRQRMLTMWTNFMKYHDPTPTVDPLLLNATWPKITGGNLTYLDINTTFSLGSNPRQYNEVKAIIDAYVQSPLATY
ncbi:hypothetical protein JTB14_006160 [Gonioctena quinquepunctata]|nr:hypothetical protein JTB14_006160 [Gonioctena quinquepunctata]